MLGTTSQAMGLCAINLMLGLIACLGAGLPASYWLIANAVLAGFCAMVWVLVTTEALCGTGAFVGFVVPVLVALWITQGHLLGWVPGLALLVTPLLGHSIADPRVTLDVNVAMGVLCQGAIGVVLYMAAMRKYRRSDRPAFSPLLGLAWVGALVMTCALGLRAWASAPLLRITHEVPTEVQVLGTLFVLMLLSVAGILSAAWAEGDWVTRCAAERIWGTGQVIRRPFPALGFALLCGAMIGLVLLVPDRRWTAGRALPTAACVFMCTAWLSYVARTAHTTGVRPALLVVAWAVALSGIPLLLDVVHRVIQEMGESLGALGAVSPVGCMIEIWGSDRPDELRTSIWTGLAVQGALTAAWAFLLHWARHGFRRKIEAMVLAEQAGRRAAGAAAAGQA